MGGCDDLLRRRFVAIATGRFDADGVYPALDVASEVATLRGWWCAPDLAQRRFEPDFEDLAAGPSEEDIKRDLVTTTRFGGGDAIVLYLTGHGVTDKGRHRTVLSTSDPERLSQTALDTITLLEWLAEHRDLEQVLLIIDLCNAGDVLSEVTKEMRAAIPDSWIALLATSAGAAAKVGAFSGAVAQVLEDIRGGSRRDVTEIEPYLASHIFIARVRETLKARYGQDLVILHDPYETSCCLPNPTYDLSGGDRVDTTPPRADLAVLEQDMTAHWRRRAPVAGEAAPWIFTGRRVVMDRLIAATTGPAGTVVVTGRAGSGKSAVLARLVTCSDPVFRAHHADLLGAVQPVPPEGAVDIAVLATGKGPEQVIAQIAGAVGAQVAPVVGASTLDPWLDGIRHVLRERDGPLTLVVDALDESSDPVGIVRSVLQRLNPPEDPVLRLIVGVRSVAGQVKGGAPTRDLASLTVEALGAAEVAVDADEYWEAGDLQTFVALALRQSPSPYASDPQRAANVAAAIAEGAERSYLLAKLVAEELAARNEPIGAGHPDLVDMLAGGVADAVRRDLIASLPDPDQRARAVVLLRAVALAFGRGIPWRDVWPTVASAIAPDGRVLGDADIESLLGGRMAGYLVRDLEDDVTVYRFVHDALRDSLARDIGRYATDGDDHPDEVAAHRRIALALLPRFGPQHDHPPAPYARRHLVEHAAAAGELDEPFLTAQTLPLLDANALSRSLRLIRAEPHSQLGLVLGAWRGVRHRWSWDAPDANAAALDVALVAAGAAAPQRPRRAGLSWTPKWAAWSFGGTVVGAEGRGLRSIAFATVTGRPCIVTAEAMQVRVWDAATSELLGRPVDADGARAVLVVAVVGRAVVVAGGVGGVRAWDAATGQPRWARRTDGQVYALAAGAVGPRALVVVGAADGTVRVLDAATGEDARPPLAAGAPVRALAVTSDLVGRQRLAVARADGTVEQVHLDDGAPAAPTISVGAEVNAVASITYGGRLLVATGDTPGRARLYDADTATPVGEECRHDGEIRSIALVDAAGPLLLATGSFDQHAVVWDPFAGQPSTDTFPHPAAVLDVQFGIADGRLMLATACADGNARLWDPIRPSAARVTTSGRVLRTALASTPDGVVLVGVAEDNGVRVWHAEDGRELAVLPLPTGRAAAVKMAGWPPVAVAVAGVDGRVVVAAAVSDAVGVWDVRDRKTLAETDWDAHLSPVAVAVDGPRVLLAHTVASDFSEGVETVHVRDVISDRGLFAVRGRTRLRNLEFVHSASGPTLAVMREREVQLVDGRTGAPRWPAVPVDTSGVALGRVGDVDVLAYWRSDGIGMWDLAGEAPFGPGIHRPGGVAQTGLAIADVDGRARLLSGHFATVRAWNPRTGRLTSELPFGTSIASLAVAEAGDGRTVVAVSGPGVVVTELVG